MEILRLNERSTKLNTDCQREWFYDSSFIKKVGTHGCESYARLGTGHHLMISQKIIRGVAELKGPTVMSAVRLIV